MINCYIVNFDLVYKQTDAMSFSGKKYFRAFRSAIGYFDQLSDFYERNRDDFIAYKVCLSRVDSGKNFVIYSKSKDGVSVVSFS